MAIMRLKNMKGYLVPTLVFNDNTKVDVTTRKIGPYGFIEVDSALLTPNTLAQIQNGILKSVSAKTGGN